MRLIVLVLLCSGCLGTVTGPGERERCEPTRYAGSGFGITAAGDTVTTVEYRTCIDTVYVNPRLP
jgi:hypothetical protein